jgi:hypothetical protein
VTDRERVTLSFPVDAEYLRLVRLACSDIGTRADFDYEDLDDLKIAASELCSLVLGAPGTMTLALEFAPGVVILEGEAALPSVPAPNQLSAAIIRALLDEHEICEDEGTVRFRAVKRARDALVAEDAT